MTVTWKGIKGHGWGTSKLEGFFVVVLVVFVFVVNQ